MIERPDKVATTIGIIASNYIEDTKRCLTSALEWTGNRTVEAIVVNNHSTDGTGTWLDEIAKTDPRLRILHTDHVIGEASAKNLVLKQSTGRTIILLGTSIEVYGDTDWSGCPRTRRSTSGGCVMIGSHCIRTWSSTQASVTLSSGEAEYYGLVKAAGAGLGHQSLMDDLGIHLPVRVWTDSSAALGIASRSGLGKLRHLETHTLWVQEKVRTGAITLRKVWGEVNPADLFTKHLPSREKVHQLLGLFGCEYRSGRAEAAPLLRPHDEDGRQGGHSADHDPLPAFAATRAQEFHDETRLPHRHSDVEINELFPVIEAADAPENCEDWLSEEGRRRDDPGQGSTTARRGSTTTRRGATTTTTSTTKTSRRPGAAPSTEQGRVR